MVAYAQFPGASGDYISSPDSAAADVVGTIELSARIRCTDWTPGTPITILSKWGPGGQLSYIWQINANGKMQLSHSTNGSAAFDDECTVATGFADGSTHWLRVHRSSASGNVDFSVADELSTAHPQATYPRDTFPAQWGFIGGTVAGTAGALFASTTQVEIGSFNSGTQNRFIGSIYRVLVSTTTGVANLVLDCDVGRAVRSSDLTLIGSTGEIWTRRGGVTFEPPDRSILVSSLGAQSTTVNVLDSAGHSAVTCGAAAEVTVTLGL